MQTGQAFADRFVELELVFFGQSDESGSRAHFGRGAEAEEHLRRDGLLSFDVGQTEPLAPEDFAALTDGDGSAGRIGFAELDFRSLLKAGRVEIRRARSAEEREGRNECMNWIEPLNSHSQCI